MAIELDYQVAVDHADIPVEGSIAVWAGAALAERAAGGSQLTVRVVDADESAALNARYRGKQGPTNVLSFPFEGPDDVDIPLLGDIVVCAPVVAREAREQGKEHLAHWAHMVVHGCLHLVGFDHVQAGEAQVMESLETRILADLGYSDPYRG